jgi:hypothetical protein
LGPWRWRAGRGSGAGSDDGGGPDHISTVIGSRRLEHGVETLLDGAEALGAQTPEAFIEFIEAAVSDEEHQELLARALTIAQDTAMRGKRRALGRALAAAVGDTGTKVDEELLFIRVLADLDELRIRLLRLMSTDPSRQWPPGEILQHDPGSTSLWALVPVLARHQLISGGDQVVPPPSKIRPDLTITENGERFLSRLAEPKD